MNNIHYHECQICYENKKIMFKSFICFFCGILCCYDCSNLKKCLKNNSCPQCRQNITSSIPDKIDNYNKLAKREDYEYLFFAQFKIGAFLLHDEKYDEAFYWIESSAMLGFNICQFLMGYLYVYGYAEDKNINTAYDWFKMSAINGFSKAKTIVGMLNHRGTIVDQNIEEAKKWYLDAANDNEYFSQYLIADIYNSENNYIEARKWFRKAAKAGCAKSNFMLGAYYEHGVCSWCGIKNTRKALKIYKTTAIDMIKLSDNTKKYKIEHIFIDSEKNSYILTDIFKEFIK